MASVDGEMVTMYGAGVDVFRVVNGKITNHWDASPGKSVVIKEHGFDQGDASTRSLTAAAIGTSIRFSSRRRAVTRTSSSSRLPSDAVGSA